MTNPQLQAAILKSLPGSTISDHQKTMVEILLPVMNTPVLKSILGALTNEKAQLGNLNNKKQRLAMKFNIMKEKITGK